MSSPSPFPWFALNVRTSGEAKVQKALETRGYPVFLPTYLDPRPYSDRIQKVRAALFPGYLFATFDPLRRLPILQTPGVVSVVSVANHEPAPIPESQLDAIRLVVDSGADATPWPYLQTGDPVTIQYGALAGVQGIILRQPEGDRLVLSIELLQRSISVQIDRTWVRPANSPLLAQTAH